MPKADCARDTESSVTDSDSNPERKTKKWNRMSRTRYQKTDGYCLTSVEGSISCSDKSVRHVDTCCRRGSFLRRRSIRETTDSSTTSGNPIIKRRSATDSSTSGSPIIRRSPARALAMLSSFFHIGVTASPPSNESNEDSDTPNLLTGTVIDTSIPPSPCRAQRKSTGYYPKPNTALVTTSLDSLIPQVSDASSSTTDPLPEVNEQEWGIEPLEQEWHWDFERSFWYTYDDQGNIEICDEETEFDEDVFEWLVSNRENNGQSSLRDSEAMSSIRHAVQPVLDAEATWTEAMERAVDNVKPDVIESARRLYGSIERGKPDVGMPKVRKRINVESGERGNCRRRLSSRSRGSVRKGIMSPVSILRQTGQASSRGSKKKKGLRKVSFRGILEYSKSPNEDQHKIGVDDERWSKVMTWEDAKSPQDWVKLTFPLHMLEPAGLDKADGYFLGQSLMRLVTSRTTKLVDIVSALQAVRVGSTRVRKLEEIEVEWINDNIEWYLYDVPQILRHVKKAIAVLDKYKTELWMCLLKDALRDLKKDVCRFKEAIKMFYIAASPHGINVSIVPRDVRTKN